MLRRCYAYDPKTFKPKTNTIFVIKAFWSSLQNT